MEQDSGKINIHKIQEHKTQSSNFLLQPTKNAVKEDPQLAKMKKQVIKLFPDMADQIMVMDKSDLQEIIQLSKTTTKAKQISSTAPVTYYQQMQRRPQIQNMMQQILKQYPDMSDQFSILDDKDIQEIYTQVKQGKLTNDDSKVNNEQNINVDQMKKSLIQRIPDYRNEILNLPNDEIIKMYTDLQKEQNSNRKKMEEKKVTKASNSVKDVKKSRNLGSQIHQKKQAKLLKKKYKCKLVFYLDQQHFNCQTNTQQGRKDGLARIIQKISKAFDKK